MISGPKPDGIGWSRQPRHHRILERLRTVATGVKIYMRGDYFWSYIYAMSPSMLCFEYHAISSACRLDQLVSVSLLSETINTSWASLNI